MSTTVVPSPPQQKITALIVRSTIVAALGGLLFGFDTAVISGITHAITVQYALTPLLLGWTVASALIGTVLGSIFAGVPGDRFGRRDSLRGLAVLYLVSSIGCALAWDWYSLLLFRAVAGLAIGGSSVLGPMYIAEIAPARWRGRMVAFFQFNIVLGIVLAYVSNYLVGACGLGDAEWRWKLGVSAVPALLFCAMLFGIPRSPRWLVKKGRLAEARHVLAVIGEPDVEGELSAIVASMSPDQYGASERLFSRKYRKPVLLAILVALFNQLSGINAILYYANHIFERAGFSKVSGDVQSMAIGITNLVFTLIAMIIIDKVGRRRLLLGGSVAMVACLTTCCIALRGEGNGRLLVWLLGGFIASFALSSGAVIWVYISEVFPNAVRSKGQSLGSSTHWITCAALSVVFPRLTESYIWVPFAFFAVMMAVQFFVVLFFFPETKGITLEEMQKRLEIGADQEASS
jgi:MFS transporter, SP family, arabinose:H+ symporter